MKVRELSAPAADRMDARTIICDARRQELIEQEEPRRLVIGPDHPAGVLTVPAHAKGLVIFALGNGSDRSRSCNDFIARRLEERGLATLLLDPQRSDMLGLLASRVVEAAEWAHAQTELSDLPIGYFGASTGGGAALAAAAAVSPALVSAVVAISGQLDLADRALGLIRAPTLLLVGGRDPKVLDLNRRAMEQMKCVIELITVPGAGHSFEEPGALDFVARRAAQWFEQRLAMEAPVTAAVQLPFPNRREAGKMLARRLVKFRETNPLILALPRGGVPIAFQVAKILGGELDLLLVRKLGAPHHPGFEIGAIVDGDMPQIIVNREVLRTMGIPTVYICDEAHRQLRELERRRKAYLGGRPPVPVEGRTVIIIDDGIASGRTVRAALRALRQRKPAHLVLAVPVGALDSIVSLADECDEIVCLATPQPFHSIATHYRNFTPISDSEVKRLLGERHPKGCQ